MAWGDKIDEFQINKNDTVIVSINIESREYNGRWYTDVIAWKVSRSGEGIIQSNAPASNETPPQPKSDALNLDEDIPF